MDKTITRTKAIRDISDKCEIIENCQDCNLSEFCKISSLGELDNTELAEVYELMFNEEVKIVDFIGEECGYVFDTKLNFTEEDHKKMLERFEADEKKKQADKINPSHYKDECSLECIEAMLIAFGSDKVYDFCICNAFKYMWRYKNKNGFEDVKKARWYVDKAKELIPEYLEWQNIDEVLTKIESEVLA